MAKQKEIKIPHTETAAAVQAFANSTAGRYATKADIDRFKIKAIESDEIEAAKFLSVFSHELVTGTPSRAQLRSIAAVMRIGGSVYDMVEGYKAMNYNQFSDL